MCLTSRSCSPSLPFPSCMLEHGYGGGGGEGSQVSLYRCNGVIVTEA